MNISQILRGDIVRKRILIGALSLAIIFCMMPSFIYANEAQETKDNTGDNLSTVEI